MSKRIVDIFFVLATSFLWIPLITVIGIALKLDSNAPIFFTQTRIGKNCIPFTIYKFRSIDHDYKNRMTRVGKFIRRYYFDEIPQFWNILKGDMSLVGPRPEQIKYVNYFNSEVEGYHLRHSVRPGITGWAQINTGNEITLENTRLKLEYDLFYIRNRSILFDLKIIFKTIYFIFKK